MDERARRIADNEALFREVNARIAGVHSELRVQTGTIQIVCECGRGDCTEQLVLPLAEYGRVRSDATRFLVLPGHEEPDVEAVVGSGEGYAVVEKTAPEARRRVREADPGF